MTNQIENFFDIMEDLRLYKPAVVLDKILNSENEHARKHIPYVFNILISRLGLGSEIKPLLDATLQCEQSIKIITEIYLRKYQKASMELKQLQESN